MQNYDQNYGFKPISSWGYIGFNILWGIPVIGWIVWLCHALGAKNKNVKNYARSIFCSFLLSVIVIGLLVVACVTLGYAAYIEQYIDAMVGMGGGVV